jgi:F-type H+-transporting ATPase subunit b
LIIVSTFLLATESEGGSAADLLLPAWPELVAGIVAFGIVFLFVRTWVWPNMSKTLEARQAAITGQMEAAEKAKLEAEGVLADYKAQLADSKTEANRILEDARHSAEQLRSEVITKAETDAEQIRAKARDEAAGEKARALADARSQVGEISVDLAGRIVGESLDADAHKSLIDRYLADLEKL